jgi:hypothetical protein
VMPPPKITTKAIKLTWSEFILSLPEGYHAATETLLQIYVQCM